MLLSTVLLKYSTQLKMDHIYLIEENSVSEIFMQKKMLKFCLSN